MGDGARPDRGVTVWFTGLSGAGKSTLAEALARALKGRAMQRIEVLDGDAVRTNLSRGLGFTREDRDTNIRRIAYVAHLLSRNGVTVIAAAISPYRDIRDEARALIGDFIEVFVDCPLEECARRDTKGLYRRALAGEIPNFTGVSDPYEPPRSPEVTIHSDRESVGAGVGRIMAVMEQKGYLPGRAACVARGAARTPTSAGTEPTLPVADGGGHDR